MVSSEIDFRPTGRRHATTGTASYVIGVGAIV